MKNIGEKMFHFRFEERESSPTPRVNKVARDMGDILDSIRGYMMYFDFKGGLMKTVAGWGWDDGRRKQRILNFRAYATALNEWADQLEAGQGDPGQCVE